MRSPKARAPAGGAGTSKGTEVQRGKRQKDAQDIPQCWPMRAPRRAQRRRRPGTTHTKRGGLSEVPYLLG
jgi:hypothetical protein